MSSRRSSALCRVQPALRLRTPATHRMVLCPRPGRNQRLPITIRSGHGRSAACPSGAGPKGSPPRPHWVWTSPWLGAGGPMLGTRNPCAMSRELLPSLPGVGPRRGKATPLPTAGTRRAASPAQAPPDGLQTLLMTVVTSQALGTRSANKTAWRGYHHPDHWWSPRTPLARTPTCCYNAEVVPQSMDPPKKLRENT
jgi:hypothetical protein